MFRRKILTSCLGPYRHLKRCGELLTWYALRLVSGRSLPFSVLAERGIAALKSEAVVAFIECALAVLPMMVADDAVREETRSTLARS